MKTDLVKPDAVLIVGNISPANYAYFKRAGVPMLLLADVSGAQAPPASEDFAQVLNTDFSTDQPWQHYLLLSEKFNIVAQMPGAEERVLSNAQLAQRTGLAAPTIEAARRARDKSAMKVAFTRRLGPNCTAQSARVLCEDDALAFARCEGFPVVLKPADLYGSMFGTISYDADGLVANYRRTSVELAAYLASVGRGDESVSMQVETFLQGAVHAIEALVDPAGSIHMFDVFDTLTERDAEGGLDNFEHYARFAPTRLSDDSQAQCKEFAARAIEALELSACIAHVEFIATPQGPRLLEIAARVGGNRAHLTNEVFGLDLMEQYFKMLAYGAALDTKPKHIRPRAVFTAFPKTKGRFAEIDHLELLRELPGYVRHTARVPLGTIVGPANRGFLPTVSVELEAPTVAELLARIQSVRDLGALVRVDPA